MHVDEYPYLIVGTKHLNIFWRLCCCCTCNYDSITKRWVCLYMHTQEIAIASLLITAKVFVTRSRLLSYTGSSLMMQVALMPLGLVSTRQALLICRSTWSAKLLAVVSFPAHHPVFDWSKTGWWEGLGKPENKASWLFNHCSWHLLFDLEHNITRNCGGICTRLIQYSSKHPSLQSSVKKGRWGHIFRNYCISCVLLGACAIPRSLLYN